MAGPTPTNPPHPSSTTTETEPTITRLSLHSYHHHALSLSSYSKHSSHAIGAIGFRFDAAVSKKTNEKDDGCTHHAGSPSFHTLSSTGGPSWRSLELAGHPGHPPVEIVRVDVFYVPRERRICGLAFFDAFAGEAAERLAWRQWEVDAEEEGRAARKGEMPEGCVCVRQEPPRDGAKWRFVGLSGEWDESVWGSVLARVGAVWRRVEEERGDDDVEL